MNVTSEIVEKTIVAYLGISNFRKVVYLAANKIYVDVSFHLEGIPAFEILEENEILVINAEVVDIFRI